MIARNAVGRRQNLEIDEGSEEGDSLLEMEEQSSKGYHHQKPKSNHQQLLNRRWVRVIRRWCLRHVSLWKKIILWLILLLIFVWILEAIGRFRFGTMASSKKKTIPMGFYKETNTFPTESRIQSVKESEMLKEWMNQRLNKTNGKKYLVGCSSEWDNYVLRAFLYLFQDLKTKFKWKDVPKGINPQVFFDSSKKNNNNKPPGVLFFCLNSFYRRMDLFHEYRVYFQSLRAKGTLIVIWNDDLHYYDQYDPIELRENIFPQIDVMVGTYAYQMDEYFDSVTRYMHPQDLPVSLWLPHSASQDFIKASKEMNTFPIQKIFLSGSLGAKWYPLRHWISKWQKKHEAFMDLYKHPGYGLVAENQTEIYASYIRSYRIGITTTMLLQYLVAKVFEIPATGSLLLVNNALSPVLEALGIKDRQHYISYDGNNPEEIIWWALDPANIEQIDTIRKEGMVFMRQNHLVQHRASSLNDFFSTQASVKYFFPSETKIGNPCPMIAYDTTTNCQYYFQKYAIYHCDRWFCGIYAMLFT